MQGLADRILWTLRIYRSVHLRRLAFARRRAQRTSSGQGRGRGSSRGTPAVAHDRCVRALPPSALFLHRTFLFDVANLGPRGLVLALWLMAVCVHRVGVEERRLEREFGARTGVTSARTAVLPLGLARLRPLGTRPRCSRARCRTMGKRLDLPRPAAPVILACVRVPAGRGRVASDSVPTAHAAYYHLARRDDRRLAVPFDASRSSTTVSSAGAAALSGLLLSSIAGTGFSYRAAIYVQVLPGTLVVLLVYAIGRRARPRTARIAAALVRRRSHLTSFSRIFSPRRTCSRLAGARVVAHRVAMSRAMSRPRAWPRVAGLPRCGVAGVIFGFATLTRAMVCSCRGGRPRTQRRFPSRRDWVVFSAVSSAAAR